MNDITPKEAIANINHIYGMVAPDIQRSLDVAIKALERPQETSEWVNDSDNIPICNKCGEVALQRIFVKMPHLIQDVRMVRSNFCPNCGADMRKENNNDTDNT